MRYLSLLSIVIITCSACKTDPEESDPDSQELPTDTTSALILPKIERPVLNIQEIKNCATQGITSFNMDSIRSPEAKLRMSLVNDTLSQISVNQNEKWHLKVMNQDYDAFKCYQWEENKDYFAFTILQKDESCCLTMYIVVCSINGEIIAIQYFGLTGSDGGWTQNDRGEKVNFVDFNLYRDSRMSTDQFDSEGNDLGSLKEYDYSEISFKWENEQFVLDTTFFEHNDTLIPLY